MQRELTVPIRIEVARRPRLWAVAFFLGCVLVCSAIMIILILNEKSELSLLGIPIIIFSCIMLNRESRSSCTKKVEATFQSDSMSLSFLIPKSRFYNSRYVDQEYVIGNDDFSSIRFQGDEVYLEARRVLSRAMENGVVLDERIREDAEIVFEAPESSAEKLREFLVLDDMS